jgi:CRP-like cAMP-binding protein
VYAGSVARLDEAGRAEFLARVPPFNGLAAAQRDELAALTRSQQLERRAELFHKGDEGSELYLVVEGRLKALTTSLEGDDIVFNIHGPGDLVGEIAMLAELPRTATIAALEPCELLALGRRDLLDFLRRHPDVAVQMLAYVSKRLAHLSELVEDTLFLRLPQRLAKKLLELSADYGDETPAGLRLDLKLSQSELGDLIGATRESVNKQLRTWASEGLLSFDAGHLVIHRLNVLEELAEG